MKNLYLKQLKDELEQTVPPLKNDDLAAIIERGIAVIQKVQPDGPANDTVTELLLLKEKLLLRPRSMALDDDKMLIYARLSCFEM